MTRELAGLRAGSRSWRRPRRAIPQTAPGLLAWIEHAAHSELHRRGRGADYPLQPLAAAIDPSEDAASLAAAMMLRERFAHDAPAVAALFAAIVGALTGGCKPALTAQDRAGAAQGSTALVAQKHDQQGQLQCKHAKQEDVH